MAKLKFSVKNAQLKKIFKQDEKGDAQDPSSSAPSEQAKVASPTVESSKDFSTSVEHSQSHQEVAPKPKRSSSKKEKSASAESLEQDHSSSTAIEKEESSKESSKSSPKGSSKSSSKSAFSNDSSNAPSPAFSNETPNASPALPTQTTAKEDHSTSQKEIEGRDFSSSTFDAPARKAQPRAEESSSTHAGRGEYTAGNTRFDSNRRPSESSSSSYHAGRSGTPTRRPGDNYGSGSSERRFGDRSPSSDPRNFSGSQNSGSSERRFNDRQPSHDPRNFSTSRFGDRQPSSGEPRRFGDRAPSSGEPRSFNGSRFGDRQPPSGEPRRFGDRAPSSGEPRSFNGSRFGDRQPPSGEPRRFGDRAPSSGEPRSFNGSRFGDRQPPSGEPRRFGDSRFGDRSSSSGEPRRFGDTGGSSGSSSQGYQRRPSDRPYSSDRPQGQNRFSSPRPAGGPSSFRPQGSRPPFGAGRPSFGGGMRMGGASMPIPPAAGKTDRRSTYDSKPKRDGASDRDWKEQKQSRSQFDRQRLNIDNDQEQETWIRRKGRRLDNSAADQSFLRPKEITVAIPVIVKDLAQLMKVKASEIIAKMLSHQVIMTINDTIDDPVFAQLIGEELGCKIHIDLTAEKRLKVVECSLDEELKATSAENLILRPPVVTVMGHVDHGKTSLIDRIRSSNRVASEAGAITQHMGAFRCETAHGAITFIDTPGHAAFIEIRSRGAKITDIVVLVVAGDEGIMPQTDESIRIAKEAGVPLVVAINKCDKPGFDIDKIYRQLAERDLLPESWGGQIITVRCSATTGEGVNELLEMLALQSEVLELKANPQARARGTVLESKISKGLGTCVTLLVQNGTLKKGDPLIFEKAYGHVKTIQDEHGKHFTSAMPGMAVLVTGIGSDEPPTPGSEFVVATNEKEARKAVEDRIRTMVKESASKNIKASYQQMFARHTELQSKKVLNLLIKADVQGSIEAIKHMLKELPQTKVEINLVDASLGEISESDIEQAFNTSAIVLGFHVSIQSHADSLIRQHGVTVKTFDVIYRLVDDVQAMMLALLDKIKEEIERGTAVIRAVFRSSQQGKIAGCAVTEGSIARSCHVKIIREKEKIWEGSVLSLKRLQEDVKEVAKGLECGIVLSGFQDFEVGDLIQFYDVVYKSQQL